MVDLSRPCDACGQMIGGGFKRYNHSKRSSLPEQKFYSTTHKGFMFIRKYSELHTLLVATGVILVPDDTRVRNLQVAE
jgi:hypothetical protein